MSRKYRIVHEPMLVEYLNKTYPPGSWRTNVRVGRPPAGLGALAVTEEERRMLTITMFSADAVVTLPGEVHIIECIVRPEWEKISKLKMYGHLYGVTESEREHWGKPRTLIMLCAVTSDFVEWFARLEGVRWIRYRPMWFEEYARGTPARTVRAPTLIIPEEEGRP